MEHQLDRVVKDVGKLLRVHEVPLDHGSVPLGCSYRGVGLGIDPRHLRPDVFVVRGLHLLDDDADLLFLCNHGSDERPNALGVVGAADKGSVVVIGLERAEEAKLAGIARTLAVADAAEKRVSRHTVDAAVVVLVVGERCNFHAVYIIKKFGSR